MSSLEQISLFDGIRRRGRKTQKPLGCPASIWGTIQKRIQRGKSEWTEHDILELVRKHANEPIGKVRKRKSEPEPPPKVVIDLVETIAFPKGTCSPMTARMIQEGKIPGITWDPDRGGVRKAHVRRLV